MFSIRRYIAVAKKETLELRRNKLFFLMTMLAPVILYFLFAFGFSLEAKNIPLGIVDLDKTELSRSLIDSFRAATDLFDIKKVVGTTHALDRELELNRIRAMVVIPAKFSKDLRSARPVTLQVIVDGVMTTYANIVGSYLEATIMAFQDRILGEFFLKKYPEFGTGGVAIDLEVSAWYNSAFRSEDFIVPAIAAIVMMFFPPLVGAISLAKEKETGSILNMFCSSITKAEYLLGKMTPYVVISYANTLLFIALSVFVFKVPMRGDLFLLVWVSVFFVASAVAIGLLVAVLVNTQIAAILITSIITLTPSFLYSGFMIPVSNVGAEGKYMAYMFPATYYIDLTRKIMVKGAQFVHLRFDIVIIIAFCFGLYLLCIALFKKRLG